MVTTLLPTYQWFKLQDAPHPFVQAMVDFLIECGLRASRPALLTTLKYFSATKFHQDINTMASVADRSACSFVGFFTSFVPEHDI